MLGQGPGTQPQQQQSPFTQPQGQQQQTQMFQQQPLQGQGQQPPNFGQQQGGFPLQQQPPGGLGQLGQQPLGGIMGQQQQNPLQNLPMGALGQGNPPQNQIQGLGNLQPPQQQPNQQLQLGQQQQGQQAKLGFQIGQGQSQLPFVGQQQQAQSPFGPQQQQNQPLMGQQQSQPLMGQQQNQPLMGQLQNQPLMGQQQNQPLMGQQSIQPSLGQQQPPLMGLQGQTITQPLQGLGQQPLQGQTLQPLAQQQGLKPIGQQNQLQQPQQGQLGQPQQGQLGQPQQGLQNPLQPQGQFNNLNLTQQPNNLNPLQQNPLQQNPLQQNPLQQNPLQQNPLQQNPLGQNKLGQNPLGQNPNPLGQNTLGQNPLGQNPLGQNPLGQAQQPQFNLTNQPQQGMNLQQGQNPLQGQVQNPLQGQVQIPLQGQGQNPLQGQVQNPLQGQVQNPQQGQGQNPLQGQGQQQQQGQAQQQSAAAQELNQPAQLPDVINRPHQQIRLATNKRVNMSKEKPKDPVFYLQVYSKEIQFFKFRTGISTGSNYYNKLTTIQLFEAIDNRVAFIQSRYGIQQLNNDKDKLKFLLSKIDVSQTAPPTEEEQFKSIIYVEDIQNISIEEFNSIRMQQLDVLEYFESYGVSYVQEQDYFLQHLNDNPDKEEVNPRSLTITSYTQLEQSQTLYESIFQKTSLTESIHNYSKELRNRRCAAGQIFKSLQQCRLTFNQELKVLEHQFYIDNPLEAKEIIHQNTINYLQNDMAAEFKDFRAIHLNRIFTKEYLNSLMNVVHHNFKIEQDLNGFYPSGILFLLIRCGRENEARRAFNEVKLKHGSQQRQYDEIFDLIESKQRGTFLYDNGFQCTDNLLNQCYTLLVGQGFVDGALSNIHVKKDPYLLIWMNLKICSLDPCEYDSGQLTLEDLQDASNEAGIINNIYVQNFLAVICLMKQEPNSLVGLLLYIVISNLGLVNQNEKTEYRQLYELAKTYAIQYFGVLIKFDRPTAFLILQLTLQQSENYREEYLSAVSDQLIRLDQLKPVFKDSKHLKQIKQILEGQEPQILYDDLQLECMSNYIQQYGHKAFIEFTSQLKDINDSKIAITQQIEKIYQKFILRLVEIQDILLLLKTRNDGYAKDFIGQKIFDLHLLWFLSILIITIEERYNYKSDKLREYSYPFQNLRDLMILIKQNGSPLWKKLIDNLLRVQESVNKKVYQSDPTLLGLFTKEEIQILSRSLIQKNKDLFFRGLYLYVDIIKQLDKQIQKPRDIEEQYSEIKRQFSSLDNKQLTVFDKVLLNSYDQIIQERLISAGLS